MGKKKAAPVRKPKFPGPGSSSVQINQPNPLTWSVGQQGNVMTVGGTMTPAGSAGYVTMTDQNGNNPAGGPPVNYPWTVGNPNSTWTCDLPLNMPIGNLPYAYIVEAWIAQGGSAVCIVDIVVTP